MSNPFPHAHALLIGAGSGQPGAVADGTGLADVLTDPEHCAYPEEQVTLLTGEEGNPQNIPGSVPGPAATVACDAL